MKETIQLSRNTGLIILLAAAFILSGCAAQRGTETTMPQQPERKAQEFSEGSEPQGFRGIRWGTEIHELNDMEYLRTDPSFGGIRTYTRQDELLRIGRAELERIEYCFWQGRFSNVWIYSMGAENWEGLRGAFFERFGVGMQVDPHTEDYRWAGDISKIRLQYDRLSEQGTAVILSTRQYEKMESW